MKIELVKINRCCFAIRKLTLLGYRYLDLSACSVDYWWSRDSEYFDECLGGIDEVKDIYKKYDREERRLNSDGIIVLARRRV